MLVSATEMLKKARDGHYAVGQFNINNLEWTKAVLLTAQELNSPVILGVSEGAGKYMTGYKTVAAMVKAMVETLNITVPVALHLDHGSYEGAKACLEAGFSSIMFDGSQMCIRDRCRLGRCWRCSSRQSPPRWPRPWLRWAGRWMRRPAPLKAPPRRCCPPKLRLRLPRWTRRPWCWRRCPGSGPRGWRPAPVSYTHLFDMAERKSGMTGENLLRILESRLDNVVYRAGFAMSRKEARQLVLHRHFTVNGKIVNIPSYLLSAGDKVEVLSLIHI